MTWAEQMAESFVQSLTQIGTAIGAFIPSFLGMLLILAVGYVVSKLVARFTSGLLLRAGFNTAARRIGLGDSLRQAQVAAEPSAIVGRLVFWLLMLVFLVSAADALGLENVSVMIGSLVGYLPNVIAAIVIAVVGLLVAGFAREWVQGAATRIGVDYAGSLGVAVYVILFILTLSLAVTQLKIDLSLINRVIEILLLAAGAGLALTLGLGTRDIARHLVAGTYARDTFTPGMSLTIGNQSGALEEVGALSTRIRSNGGEAIYVPNGRLVDEVVSESDRPS
jgi:small-conductance mechanosensitive channel